MSDRCEGIEEPTIKVEPPDTSLLDPLSAVKTEPADMDNVYSLKEETIDKAEINIEPTVIRLPHLQSCKQEPAEDTTAGTSHTTEANSDYVKSYSTFSDQANVSTASVNEDESPRYYCPTCNKHFAKNNILTKHMKIHTGERPFICEICKKSYTQKSGLNSHMRTHTGERPYKCEVCKKSFSQVNILNNHMVTHTNERLFDCEFCNKYFKLKSDLNTHLRKHSDERPYICEICKKGFKVRHNLMKHKKIHTGERPYSCGICKKCFTRNYSLKYHMNTHKP